MAEPPFPGETSAIIVPVAVAEPLVSGWRLRHDGSAAAGIPAHVTVLAPFLAPELIGSEVLGDLRALFAGQPAVSVRFARTGRFPASAGAAAGVLYLDPEPADRLLALTEAVVARWPQAPPYGGQFAEIVPHLTVAIAEPPALDAIERELTAALSDGFTATLDRAELYIRAGARWRAVATLPLAGG